MNKNKFVKVGLVVPKIKLGDAYSNAIEIVKIIEKDKKNAILLFPELTITGYSLGDWIFNRQVLEDAKLALKYILEHNDNHLIIIGSVLEFNGSLFDVAYVIQGNDILGIVPKYNLKRHRDSNEPRYFNSGACIGYEETVEIEIFDQTVPFGSMLFKSENGDVTFGVEIGCDNQDVPPVNNLLYRNGAEIVFNLSSSAYNIKKNAKLVNLCSAASLNGFGAYVYTSTGVSETSSDVLFDGEQIVCCNGEVLLNQNNLDNYNSKISYADIDLEVIKYNRLISGNMCSNDLLVSVFDDILYEDYHLDLEYNNAPFITNEEESDEILKVVSNALYNRLTYSKAKGLVIGISGGLDSTLALLMAVYMCDRFNLNRKMIHGITMPAMGTSSKSKDRSINLMKKLEIDDHIMDVNLEVGHHLDLIGHDGLTKDIAYENSQARYRTLVLMNFANANSSLVVGTGDMSEIALGFATFNGDHMAMYNVNSGIPKTAIRHLTRHFIKYYPEVAEELEDVCNAMISPELVSSAQSTEDFLGKYEINDFILYELLANGSSKERLVFLMMEVFKLNESDAETYYDRFLRRFKAQQYKRLTGPEGIKVFEVSLSARSELKMPGDLY
ncbi:MAG: NAD(+) synthase [Bacilli bacterium]|nr:NAD(+) synthase [Bacilli bacterium]